MLWARANIEHYRASFQTGSICRTPSSRIPHQYNSFPVMDSGGLACCGPSGERPSTAAHKGRQGLV